MATLKMNVRTATTANDWPSVPGSTRCSNLTLDWTAALTTASIEVSPSQNIEIRTRADVGRCWAGRAAVPSSSEPVVAVLALGPLTLPLPPPPDRVALDTAYDAVEPRNVSVRTGTPLTRRRDSHRDRGSRPIRAGSPGGPAPRARPAGRASGRSSRSPWRRPRSAPAGR